MEGLIRKLVKTCVNVVSAAKIEAYETNSKQYVGTVYSTNEKTLRKIYHKVKYLNLSYCYNKSLKNLIGHVCLCIYLFILYVLLIETPTYYVHVPPYFKVNMS